MDIIAPELQRIGGKYSHEIYYGTVIQPPTEILPNLYLFGADGDIHTIQHKNIVGALCVGVKADIGNAKWLVDSAKMSLSARLYDHPNENIYDSLDTWADFIRDTLDTCSDENDAVVVFCRAGMSRSASAIAYYLVKHRSISLRDALCFLMEKRCIAINSGFVLQLYLKCTGQLETERHAHRDRYLYCWTAADGVRRDYYHLYPSLALAVLRRGLPQSQTLYHRIPLVAICNSLYRDENTNVTPSELKKLQLKAALKQEPLFPLRDGTECGYIHAEHIDQASPGVNLLRDLKEAIATGRASFFENNLQGGSVLLTRAALRLLRECGLV